VREQEKLMLAARSELKKFCKNNKLQCTTVMKILEKLRFEEND
jgi:hypothetical protein